MQPRYTDSLPSRITYNRSADFHDGSDNLMPGNDRRPMNRQVALRHMKIRTTNPTSGDLDQQFIVSRLGLSDLRKCQRAPFDRRWFLQNACFHHDRTSGKLHAKTG
jgi:hypothetical protein